MSFTKGKAILVSLLLPILASAACIPSGDQTAINEAFKKGGRGTEVELCYDGVYKLTAPIVFTDDDQTLRSWNYNTDVPIQPAPGSSLATLVKSNNHNNITLKYIAVYGNRASMGAVKGGGGAIELGGDASKFNLLRVTCQDPRGHSCIHFTGGENCRNAVVEDGTIRSVIDADGIRLNCRDSDIRRTDINGFTGIGINVLGASGSQIHENKFISASRAPAKAAIALVDPTYDYDGVRVYDNYMRGSKLLYVGIAVGSHIFPGYDNSYHPFGQGPINITGNDAAGRVGFLMAVNGWANGINAPAFQDSYYASRRALSKTFVDTTGCDSFVKDAIAQSTNYSYWKGGLQGGPTKLDKGFYDMNGDGRNFDCMKSLPAIRTYKRGELDMLRGNFICDFSSVSVGINQYGVFDVDRADGSTGFVGQWCSTQDCRLKFTKNGDFVQVEGTGKVIWSTKTVGTGNTLECIGGLPYLRILDAAGKEIWNAGLKDDEI